mmetsp:Transcript_126620/g.300817  ORF Transcript_126620/g.300817 Transcript_126620/m.300817 type:complete len:402 (-) Transcript_126620:893-2098(-)
MDERQRSPLLALLAAPSSGKLQAGRCACSRPPAHRIHGDLSRGLRAHDHAQLSVQQLAEGAGAESGRRHGGLLREALAAGGVVPLLPAVPVGARLCEPLALSSKEPETGRRVGPQCHEVLGCGGRVLRRHGRPAVRQRRAGGAAAGGPGLLPAHGASAVRCPAEADQPHGCRLLPGRSFGPAVGSGGTHLRYLHLLGGPVLGGPVPGPLHGSPGPLGARVPALPRPGHQPGAPGLQPRPQPGPQPGPELRAELRDVPQDPVHAAAGLPDAGPAPEEALRLLGLAGACGLLAHVGAVHSGPGPVHGPELLGLPIAHLALRLRAAGIQSFPGRLCLSGPFASTGRPHAILALPRKPRAPRHAADIAGDGPPGQAGFAGGRPEEFAARLLHHRGGLRRARHFEG